MNASSGDMGAQENVSLGFFLVGTFDEPAGTEGTKDGNGGEHARMGRRILRGFRTHLNVNSVVNHWIISLSSL